MTAPEFAQTDLASRPIDEVQAPVPELLAALADPRTRLISFDVFDTVITRRVSEPAALPLLLGTRLRAENLIHCTPEVFARIRLDCERRARRNRLGNEVTLRQIYEEMVFGLPLGDRLPDLMKAEIDAEAEAISVIPRMQPMVEMARSRFGRVVFISDTYLPHIFLEGRLQSLGLLRSGDRLYVSSDFGVQKGDGRLFRIVLEQEGLEPAALFHCGDSLQYDVTAARAMGIRGHRFIDAIPSASEAALNGYTLHTSGASALLAGAARLARLEGAHLESDARAVWDTGASVTGPLVFLYASWIIERARQMGLRRLYFLARDAYLPYLAVQALLRARTEYDLEPHYVYGSRLTYATLDVDRVDAQVWDNLMTHGGQPYATIDELQLACMSDTATFETHLAGLGFTQRDWKRPLSTHELGSIRDHALSDPAFGGAILDGLRSSQKLAREYLAQNGFDPEVGIALIDSGWTTKSHAPLFRFLQAEGCRNLRVFYIGVKSEATEIPSEAIDVFLFDRSRQKGVMRDHLYYPRAVETLLLADHGRTVAFRRRDGIVEPVLAELESADFLRQYFDAYRQGLLTFVERASATALDVGRPHDLRQVAERLVARFWLEPSVDEAHLWSQLQWEWDPHGNVTYPLARPYRISDAVRAFTEAGFPECHPQFWAAGARQLTPAPTRHVLSGAIALRRGLSRLLGAMPSALRDPLAALGRRILGTD